MMHTCPSQGILNNLQSTTITYDINSKAVLKSQITQGIPSYTPTFGLIALEDDSLA